MLEELQATLTHLEDRVLVVLVTMKPVYTVSAVGSGPMILLRLQSSIWWPPMYMAH